MPTTTAIRLHHAGEAGARVVRRDEIDLPEPGTGQVLVDVRAVALGPADGSVVAGRSHRDGPLPMILGREAVGIVSRHHAGAGGWRPGDAVALLAIRVCRRCAYCLAGRDNLCARAVLPGVDADGTLATSVVADVADLVPLPGALDPARAAMITDTVASAYHALKRTGIGEDVTISVHGLGAVGLHAVQLARLAGCRVVGVDPDPDARGSAGHAGVDSVVDAADGDTLSALGADRALVCSPDQAAIAQAVDAVRPGGRVTVVAPESTLPPIAAARLVTDEIELVGSFGATAQDVGELVDLLDDGRLELMGGLGAELTLDDAAAHLTAEAVSRAVVLVGDAA